MPTPRPMQLKACAGVTAEKLLFAVAAEVNIRNKKKITETLLRELNRRSCLWTSVMPPPWPLRASSSFPLSRLHPTPIPTPPPSPATPLLATAYHWQWPEPSGRDVRSETVQNPSGPSATAPPPNSDVVAVPDRCKLLSLGSLELRLTVT
jgi:hypothetical protein